MALYRPKRLDPVTGKKIFGRTYVMDFLFHGQRIRESTGMTSISRAREVEAKRKRELQDGSAGIRKQAAPRLLRIAAREWLERKEHKWSPRMKSIAEYALGHLLPVLGKQLVVDIGARDIARYQRLRLAEGASGRTVNIEVGCLRQILKRVGQWERLRSSDEWGDVGMLQERSDVGRRLSSQEESRLLLECGRSPSRALLPFVVLLLETGSRFGTVRTLTWGQIDFAKRELKFGKDKTAAGSGRVVPLSNRAVATLELWAAQFPDRKPLHFAFPTERYGLHGEEGRFGGEVRPYDYDPLKAITTLKSSWTSAKKRTSRHCPNCMAGILADAEKPATGYYCVDCNFEVNELPEALKLRLHDLRHTAVSRMVSAGIPLTVIARIVGWSASTTAAMAVRYAHANEEELRSAVETISAGSPRIPPQVELTSKATVN